MELKDIISKITINKEWHERYCKLVPQFIESAKSCRDWTDWDKDLYGAQNEAYNIERGQKTPKAVYLQRVARVEAMRSAQNETFT